MRDYVNFGKLMTKHLLTVFLVCFCCFPQPLFCQSDRSLDKGESQQQSTSVEKYQFTSDWVTGKIPVWKKVLSQFKGKPHVCYLEVGVYEGRSLIWMLENILTHPTSEATCIDIFPRDVEQRFLANLEISGCAKRTTIIKGYSQVQLRKLPFSSFDIIYIDGSHTAPDVLADALLCWPLLRKDGILIFDDYKWKRNKYPPLKRPEMAIEAFVGNYVEYVDTVHIGWQFIVQKTGYTAWER